MYLAYQKFLNPPIDANIKDVFVSEDFQDRVPHISLTNEFLADQILKGAIRNILNTLKKANSFLFSFKKNF